MSDIFPEQRFAQPQKRQSAFYGVAIAGAVLVGAFVVAYIFWTEAHKYDEIYQGMGTVLPPQVEGAVSVKFRLDELRIRKCDQDAIDALRRAIVSIGYKTLGEAATENLTEYCRSGGRKPNTSVATTVPIIESLKFFESANIRGLARKLSDAPCSPPLTVELVYSLNSEKEYRKAVDIGERHLSVCSKDAGVGYNTAKGLFWMGNYQKALSTLQLFPKEVAQNLYFAGWQGHILEKLDRNEEAAASFERALDVADNIKSVGYAQFLYATQAYKTAGQFCRAIKPLQRYVSIDPVARASSEIDAMISDLAKRGNCPI